MHSADHEWLTRIAHAACSATRWISIPSLVIAAFALGWLFVEPLPLMLRAALTLIVFCGGAQAYIAFRIAMDGPMFGAWARAQWAGADVLDAFDRALHQLRLSNTPSRSRTLEERVRGLFALVRVSAGLFVLQLAAALAACWI
jgi:hypothetical protein